MPKTREYLVKYAQALRPSFLSRTPHFNFISVHYFWIIGWSIIASILIYASGRGNIAYIDALVFGAGANTQAGLNTVDINKLNTFQQVVMYVCALLSNPITIHSSVVFLRLYWFEKRFQNIVQEARSRRVTITKSRAKNNADTSDRERGVNGRDINVVYATGKPARMTNDGILLDDNQSASDPKPSSAVNTSGSEHSSDHRSVAEEVRVTPQIKFAPEVRRSDAIDEHGVDDDEPVPLPSRRSHAEHIAILEKQRKVDKSVLRIPGPRDADRGALPEELDEDLEEPPDMQRRRRESSLEPAHSRPIASLPRRSSNFGERPAAITIEVPDHPHRHEDSKLHEVARDAEAASHTLDCLKFWKVRRKGEQLHQTTSTTSSRLFAGMNPLHRIRTVLSQSKEDDPTPYLSWQATLGRNSAFVDLTEEQREELGGIEYRSLKTLGLFLTIYFWGFSILGIITLLPWILNSSSHIATLREDGIDAVWWGFWTANSAFMDLGFTLTPDSMNSFNTATFPLLIMSVLILLGNTGFPIALRFMIWVGSLVAPRGSGLWEELRFLLDHPRRCFTLLFPSNATWWLFFTLVILNVIDLVLFVILDLGAGFVAALPLNIRFLDGWFQATSTRTAGFSCINLALVHPAVQTSYLIMMYISVFPVAISIRRTNVYEEKSLGVYAGAQDDDDDQQPNISYVGTHLRRQLSFDLWFVFLGFFILSITEGGRITSGDFDQFAVLFEIVSAYGTVGLSLGYPTVNTSLVGQFSVLGKLVIAAMMIRGRHRGLPYGLDRAVLLPSEGLVRKEGEDADLRLQRRPSGASAGPTDRRAQSRKRGRSRSVDRSHLLTGLLHPGPTWTMAKSESRSKQVDEPGLPGPSNPLRRHVTAPISRSTQETSMGIFRHRRTETQPAFDS